MPEAETQRFVQMDLEILARTDLSSDAKFVYALRMKRSATALPWGSPRRRRPRCTAS